MRGGGGRWPRGERGPVPHRGHGEPTSTGGGTHRPTLPSPDRPRNGAPIDGGAGSGIKYRGGGLRRSWGHTGPETPKAPSREGLGAFESCRCHVDGLGKWGPWGVGGRHAPPSSGCQGPARWGSVVR